MIACHVKPARSGIYNLFPETLKNALIETTRKDYGVVKGTKRTSRNATMKIWLPCYQDEMKNAPYNLFFDEHLLKTTPNGTARTWVTKDLDYRTSGEGYVTAMLHTVNASGVYTGSVDIYYNAPKPQYCAILFAI